MTVFKDLKCGRNAWYHEQLAFDLWFKAGIILVADMSSRQKLSGLLILEKFLILLNFNGTIKWS